MQTITMQKNTSPGHSTTLQRCVICSSPEGNLENSILENEKTLKKTVQKVFQYLLVSYKNFREITDDKCIVFCCTCIISLEEIAKIQQKKDNLELQIQHKVETLGRLLCSSSSPKEKKKITGRPKKVTAVVWEHFKNPVIKNFIDGLLPNPSVKIFTDVINGKKTDEDKSKSIKLLAIEKNKALHILKNEEKPKVNGKLVPDSPKPINKKPGPKRHSSPRSKEPNFAVDTLAPELAQRFQNKEKPHSSSRKNKQSIVTSSPEFELVKPFKSNLEAGQQQKKKNLRKHKPWDKNHKYDSSWQPKITRNLSPRKKAVVAKVKPCPLSKKKKGNLGPKKVVGLGAPTPKKGTVVVTNNLKRKRDRKDSFDDSESEDDLFIPVKPGDAILKRTKVEVAQVLPLLPKSKVLKPSAKIKKQKPSLQPKIKKRKQKANIKNILKIKVLKLKPKVIDDPSNSAADSSSDSELFTRVKVKKGEKLVAVNVDPNAGNEDGSFSASDTTSGGEVDDRLPQSDDDFDSDQAVEEWLNQVSPPDDPEQFTQDLEFNVNHRFKEHIFTDEDDQISCYFCGYKPDSGLFRNRKEEEGMILKHIDALHFEDVKPFDNEIIPVATESLESVDDNNERGSQDTENDTFNEPTDIDMENLDKLSGIDMKTSCLEGDERKSLLIEEAVVSNQQSAIKFKDIKDNINNMFVKVRDLVEGLDYYKCPKCEFSVNLETRNSTRCRARQKIYSHYSERHNPVDSKKMSKSSDGSKCYNCTKCDFAVKIDDNKQKSLQLNRQDAYQKLSKHYIRVHDKESNSISTISDSEENCSQSNDITSLECPKEFCDFVVSVKESKTGDYSASMEEMASHYNSLESHNPCKSSDISLLKYDRKTGYKCSKCKFVSEIGDLSYTVPSEQLTNIQKQVLFEALLHLSRHYMIVHDGFTTSSVTKKQFLQCASPHCKFYIEMQQNIPRSEYNARTKMIRHHNRVHNVKKLTLENHFNCPKCTFVSQVNYIAEKSEKDCRDLARLKLDNHFNEHHSLSDLYIKSQNPPAAGQVNDYSKVSWSDTTDDDELNRLNDGESEMDFENDVTDQNLMDDPLSMDIEAVGDNVTTRNKEVQLENANNNLLENGTSTTSSNAISTSEELQQTELQCSECSFSVKINMTVSSGPELNNSLVEGNEILRLHYNSTHSRIYGGT